MAAILFPRPDRLRLRAVVIALLLLLALAGLAATGLSALNQLACEGQPIINNEAPTADQQIWGEAIIGQDFVAPRDGLNRIDLILQTYGRRNTHDVTLRLLAVPPDIDHPLHSPEIFRATFNASTVRDRAWRSFSLPPIPDSGGKTYLITLQSPQSEPGNAITVGGIERDLYQPGGAYFGPVPVQADIAFRTCYRISTAQKLQLLARQITAHRPGPWGHTGFYLLLLVIYALLLAGFLWKLRL